MLRTHAEVAEEGTWGVRLPRPESGGGPDAVPSRCGGLRGVPAGDGRGPRHARHPLRILAYCVLSNHWHFLVWPRADGEVTDYFRWRAHTHAMRWRVTHRTVGYGHLYQGRFKSFPVQGDEHLLRVARYVECIALGARLVEWAELWPHGSLRAIGGRRPDAGDPLEPAGQAAVRLEGTGQRAPECPRAEAAASKPGPGSALRRGRLGRPDGSAAGTGAYPPARGPASQEKLAASPSCAPRPRFGSLSRKPC